MHRTFLAAILLVAAGCSTGRSEREPQGSPAAGERTASGTVSAELALPDASHFTTVAYTLANGTNTLTGTLQVADAGTLSFAVGSVSGTGYTLTLEAASDDGHTMCTGTSSPFDVANQTTTVVNLRLSCRSTTDAGSVLVDAVATNCPTWTTIYVNPASAYTTRPANTMELTATAFAPDPASMSFTWTAAAGTISPDTQTDAGIDTVIFTCPSTPGPVPITMTVSDGPVPSGGGCDLRFTRATFTVSCVAAPGCTSGTGCGDGGQVCNAAGSCVPALFSVVVLNSLNGGAIDSLGTYLPVSIQNYDLTGAAVGAPITLPTGASGSNQPVTLSGNNVTEGDLTVSGDGRLLVTSGWNVVPGGNPRSTSNLAAVVATIDSAGNVDSSTTLPGAFLNPLSTRSAVTGNGSFFWVSGSSTDTIAPSSGGIWLVPAHTAAPAQLVSLPYMDGVRPDFNASWLRIVGGQLFGDFVQAPPDVPALYLGTIGSGLPTDTSTTPALTDLPGGFQTPTGSPSPYGFAIFDLQFPPNQLDTLYLADDGINPNGTNNTAPATGGSGSTGGGGISKWTYDPSTSGWSQVWNVSAGTWPGDAGTFANAPIGFRGLAGFATGTTVTLMATTANNEGNPDSLAVLVDNGGSTPPTPTIVATTPTTQVFRGIALAPQ